jgi:hypothetical protein
MTMITEDTGPGPFPSPSQVPDVADDDGRGRRKILFSDGERLRLGGGDDDD